MHEHLLLVKLVLLSDYKIHVYHRKFAEYFFKARRRKSQSPVIIPPGDNHFLVYIISNLLSIHSFVLDFKERILKMSFGMCFFLLVYQGPFYMSLFSAS